MDARNSYNLTLSINGRVLRRIIIDQHYALKHKDINDALILQLLRTLNHETFNIDIKKGEFEYFAIEPVTFENKHFRLILVISEHEDYLGVVNAFRVKRKKL